MKTYTILHFRTMQNGSLRLRKGQKKGYWRVLVVADPKGSTSLNSKNVIKVLDRTSIGINGVTERSKYYIGSELEKMKAKHSIQ